jgi:hypothetical protein
MRLADLRPRLLAGALQHRFHNKKSELLRGCHENGRSAVPQLGPGACLPTLPKAS